MKNFYEAYGALAGQTDDRMILAGRNLFHEPQLAAICRDIRAKLDLQPNDRLLEIGCNVGTLLTPLSAFVREAVGQDHPDVLARYGDLGLVPSNVSFVGGMWPVSRPAGRFDKILIYAVMITLPNQAVADAMIDACLETLQPGGRLLIGDLPNSDMRRRFLASSEGAAVSGAYEALRRQDHAANPAAYDGRARLFAQVEEPPAFLDDGYAIGLLTRIRAAGCEAWLLPQPGDLPACHTREDLLVWKRQ